MTRYHPFLVVLHWLLAAMIIGGLIMGGNVLAKTPNADPEKTIRPENAYEHGDHDSGVDGAAAGDAPVYRETAQG